MRALIDRIQEARLVFPQVSPLPVKIYVLGKGDWFGRLRPSSTATAFASTDRSGTNVIVLSSAADSRALMHEYAHLVIEQMAILPPWLDEGFAEVYSTAEVRSKRLTIGRAIGPHAARLRQSGVPALKDLMAVRGQLPAEHYAAAWSLAHMLRFGSGYRQRFGSFWSLVQKGGEADQALITGFGKTISQIEGDWASYVTRTAWPTEDVTAAEPIQALAKVESGAVSQEDFEEEYVDLLRTAGRTDEATRLLAGLRDRPSPHRLLRKAQASLAEGHLEAARQAYREAAAAGMEGDGWYEYGALLRDVGAPAAEIRSALEKAVELSPGLRPARLLLASTAMQAGDHAAAARHLETAAARSPRSFDVWYELAFAQRAAGAAERSREAAARARLVARTVQEREKAEALLTPASGLSTSLAQPATKTSTAWMLPRGDASVTADWEELICAEPAQARFKTDKGSELLLTIRDPSKVTLDGAGGVSTEMKCGAQSPARRVHVEFDSQTRELRALRFLEP